MAGGGFSVSVDELKALQGHWRTAESIIKPLATRLASMDGEIASAAENSPAYKDKTRHALVVQLMNDAQQAVNAAQAALSTLSSQLSADEAKLGQTAETYELAELMAKDHIKSIGQLASYTGPDSGQIRSQVSSLLKDESPNQQAQMWRQAGSLVSDAVGSGSTSSASGDGSSSGTGSGTGSGGGDESVSGPGGGAQTTESGGGGYGGGSASGSAYGGSAGGSGGGAGGGYTGGGGYAGTGTPVAPDMAASSAQVKQWVQQAIKIMEKEGIPASKIDPNAIALIIQHESGGNPNAINLTDSNAVAGHPSQGLMQTIPSTFDAYALPGHGNILNPVDNIIAGTRYALSRYGSLDSVPGVIAVEQGGSYVGY